MKRVSFPHQNLDIESQITALEMMYRMVGGVSEGDGIPYYYVGLCWAYERTMEIFGFYVPPETMDKATADFMGYPPRKKYDDMLTTHVSEDGYVAFYVDVNVEVGWWYPQTEGGTRIRENLITERIKELTSAPR